MTNSKLLLRHIVSRYRRFYSKSAELNENEPIKFSTSPASRKVVRPIIVKNFQNIPWYQPWSVITSVAVFMIYFCVLRQENDIDLEFNRSLYDRIKGLEKQQLLQIYQHNKENGKSVEDIERRLLELEAEENKL